MENAFDSISLLILRYQFFDFFAYSSLSVLRYQFFAIFDLLI